MNARPSDHTVSIVDHALDYARRGFAVLPCSANDKLPLLPRDKDENGEPIPKTGGLYKASRDEAQIRQWWRQYPGALIGLRMGAEAGVFAVDPDRPKKPEDPDGLAAWTELRGGSGNLHRRVEWSFCLTAAKLAADQEQP